MSTEGPAEEDLGAEAIDFTGPAVYMFRPSHFVKVKSERMAEWERTLATRVGIRLAEDRAATPTWSLCGGTTAVSEICDCDEI